MIRFIVSLLILALLALVVALNQTSTANLNLLGVRLESIPTIVVAIVGFALGVASSVVVYLMGVLDKRRIRAIRAREQELARREQAVAQKETEAAAQAANAVKSAGGEPASPAPTRGGKLRRWLAGKDKPQNEPPL